MKPIPLTIRTKLLILILLVLTSGLLVTLLFRESLFQVRNASRLKQDAIQLSRELPRFESILKDLDKPSSSLTWLSISNGSQDAFTSALSEISALLDQLAVEAGSVGKNSLERNCNQLKNHFSAYKNILIRIYSDYKERGTTENGLALKLSRLSTEFSNRSSIKENGNLASLAASFPEYTNAWISTGEPIYLEDLTRLVYEAKISSNGSGNVLPDRNPENLISEAKTVLQRLLLLQESLHRESGEGLLATFTGEHEQMQRYSKQFLDEVKAYEMGAFRNAVRKVSLIILVIILVVAVYLYFFSRNLRKSLDDFRHFLSELVSGRIPEKLQVHGQDEFAEMAASLDIFSADLQKKAQFAKGIGHGNLESEYKPLSEDDLLGNALIGLQKNLQEAQVAQIMHEAEEKKRRWINEGLTKFAEILRMNNNDLGVLSDQIVQNTVTYLEANQGGLFLMNENEGDEPVLDLVSSFAYDRKKYLTKTIKLGEGLVGNCAIEKQPMLLTEVPDEYLTITSGLGESNPSCIVLVPLKLEENVLGVIEIASFRLIEQHQLDFLVKIAESIASTIATVRINMRTESLLEQSQHQSRILADQEEEMRQSMEELQATQEESKRRETEITGILNAINSSSLVLEFDMLERVSIANERFCALVDTSLEHLKGKKYSSLFLIDMTSEAYIRLWDDLKMGLDKAQVECVRSSSGPEIWVSMSLTPLRAHDNKITKVLCIAHDISDSKLQEKNLQKQSQEINRKNRELESLNHAVDTALLRCAYDQSGCFIDANDNYAKLTGYNLREIVGKDSKAFLKPDEQVQFDKIWSEVLKDKAYTGVIKRTKPTGEELWLMSNFTPVKDEKGSIYKVYYLGQDITERKLKYKLLEEANKEIERLKAQLGGR